VFGERFDLVMGSRSMTGDGTRASGGEALRGAGPVGALKEVAGVDDPAGRPLRASILICAYADDRWQQLVDAVRSTGAQTVAPLERIVVVDHNPALLQRVRAHLPDVIALENRGRRGLAGARNEGVSAASGDVIAFLDDDAVAEPDWLERLLRPYDQRDVVGVGGAIEPLWPGDRPALLAPEFDWVVGCTYRGMPTERAPVRNVIGANMSFRRSVLVDLGAFRDGLGRVGRHPLGCEETELCIRAHQAWPSARIVFEPSARVHHHVSADRVTWRYFRSRCYAEGLSKVAVSRHTGARDGLSSERTHAFKALPRAVAREIAAAARRRDARGLARAAAIVAGLAITVAGYGVGTLQGAGRAVLGGTRPGSE
jgi:GT2 family glycosyltransferase